MVKNKTNKKKDKKVSKEEVQIKWVLITIGFVFVVFFSAYFFVQSLNNFQSHNLKWEKIKEGELTFYHSKLMISDNPPRFLHNYFRFDPRENKIPVEIGEYMFEDLIFISNSEGYLECKNTQISNAQLALFLSSFGRETRGSVNNPELAKEMNVTFADCSKSSFSQTVIVLENSETPYVVQNETYPQCYHLYVGQCENIKTVERFLLGIIEGGLKKN